MSETASNVIRYIPHESGDGESRWIRLEQLRPEDEALTVAEAASIIDSLYDIEPCDDGMGGGGEEEDEPPEEEKFDALMAEMLRRAGVCDEAEYWTAVVDVLRSHKQPVYVLRSETATVDTTTPVRESFREVVEASGAVIELSMPYDGNLRGIPAGVSWEARGSTINLDRPVSGRIALRYDTYYERVTLRVPTGDGGWLDPQTGAAMPPQNVTVGPTSSDGTERKELPSASVVAFWGDLAASCELDPPEQDETMGDDERQEICGRGSSPDHDWTDPSGCWKTVRTYDRCNCSGSEVNAETTWSEVPCDGAAHGSQVGHEEVFRAYVHCDGEEDEDLRDEEFYRARCCKDPPRPWTPPRCRRIYERWRGGEPIEHGAEHWKNIYGDDVVMIPVLPEGGYCGEKITEWNVPQKNCCDGVPPLELDTAPEEVLPGGEYSVFVNGGKAGAELLWQAAGGIVFAMNGATTYRTEARRVTIRGEADMCPRPTITVTDDCSKLEIVLSGPEGEGPKLPEDMEIGSGTFSVTATGGVKPYMWQASGVTLRGWSADGSTAYFDTPPKDEWCMGSVTVVDVCGRDDTMTIMNASRGEWIQVPVTDEYYCSPPGGPYKLTQESSSGEVWGVGGGYKVRVMYSRRMSSGASGGCDVGPGPCDTGNEIVPGGQYLETGGGKCGPSDSSYTYTRLSKYCCRKSWTSSPDYPGGWTYTGWFQWVERVWKFTCQ